MYGIFCFTGVLKLFSHMYEIKLNRTLKGMKVYLQLFYFEESTNPTGC